MQINFNKIKKGIRNPLCSLRFAKTVLITLWYRLKYEKLLGRARFGKGIRIQGKLIIRGPGKVIFGNNVVCAMTVTPFTHSCEAIIKIGDSTFLNGTRFGAAKLITVGERCILADCRIMDTDFHSLRKDRHSLNATVEISPVYIGNNVWIGAQSAVLKGVSIGVNSVIGFGAVVTNNIESNVIAVGNPAKAVKQIPQ